MDSPARLVGIDLGTTVCKAVVFDQELRELSSASCQIGLHTLSGSEIEQDAEEWWTAVQEVVRTALAGSTTDARTVRGLSISSQGISFVPVDENGSPLRAAFSWLDTRATEQRDRVLEHFGEQAIFSLTGKRCNEAYVLPKMLWLREHEPDVWDRCRRVLMPMDFIVARLTGEYITDHTMASGTMYYDITKQTWAAPIVDALGLDPAKLPEIQWAGCAVGRLRPDAATALGLSQDVVVSVGGQDQKVAALGAGLDLDGCTVSLGTALAIEQKCSKPVIDEQMRLPCFSDLVSERWIIEGAALCCSVLDWAKNALFPTLSWDELNRKVEESAGRPHPIILLPFFSGAMHPYNVSAATGTLSGLDLSTTPAQIVRSVYEGIAFLIRANVKVMEEIYKRPQGIRVFGGGARSDVWCRIIADVIQQPVSVLVSSEAASVGAGFLAGLGCGIFSDPAEAADHVAMRATFDPRPERASQYDDLYGQFNSLAGRLFEPEHGRLP